MIYLYENSEWEIAGTEKVVKFIRKKKVQSRTAKKIWNKVNGLKTNPFPPDAGKLQNRPGYRIRIGKIRIIYNVDKSQYLVTILNIGFRGGVYEEWEYDELEYLRD